LPAKKIHKIADIIVIIKIMENQEKISTGDFLEMERRERTESKADRLRGPNGFGPP
jgi:hypothetical protein